MLSAIGSALVAGSTPERNMATRRIKVLRAFYIAGKAQAVGALIECNASLASELIAVGKAEAVAPEPAAPAPAPASEAAPPDKGGKKSK